MKTSIIMDSRKYNKNGPKNWSTAPQQIPEVTTCLYVWLVFSVVAETGGLVGPTQNSFVIMVKTNQKPVTAQFSKSNDSQNSFRNSSNVASNSGSPEEDSWVIVKKQKVNILIPRLPSSEQCRLPDLDSSQSQLNVDMPAARNLTTTPSQFPQQKLPDTCLTERIDDVIPPSPEPDKVTSNPGPEKTDLREHNFEDQDDVAKSLCRKKRSHLKLHGTAYNPSRDFGQPWQLRVNLSDCIAIPDKTMRASNVKLKISRAGGLHRWLTSLGLEQFERVFHGTDISRFLLANLSMNKLKEMGYDAVGPRRKLIHAIECLCQSDNVQYSDKS